MTARIALIRRPPPQEEEIIMASTFKPPAAEATWDALVKIEPALGALLKRAQRIKDDRRKPSFCANALWYGYDDPGMGLKNQFNHLVGFHARGSDPRIRTTTAYDVAYKRIYEALPDCRNCLCLGGRG